MNIGTLYIVGTPIGNLKDITYRAIDVLTNVDFIAAEDTRVTIKLLNYYNIKNNLISYHEHSMPEKINKIIQKILSGQNCALVSDAGMPCISDPGEKLVKQAIKENIHITVVPGPCAAISGLVVSGLKTSKFVFEGFLSTNKNSRLSNLKKLIYEERAIIFYEAPHKLKNTLGDLFDIFGNRNIVIIKEMTKIHENVMYMNLKDAVDYFQSVDVIKGEFVLILDGYKNDEEEIIDINSAISMIKELNEKNQMSISEAVKFISQKTGYKKNMLYKLVVESFSSLLK